MARAGSNARRDRDDQSLFRNERNRLSSSLINYDRRSSRNETNDHEDVLRCLEEILNKLDRLLAKSSAEEKPGIADQFLKSMGPLGPALEGLAPLASELLSAIL